MDREIVIFLLRGFFQVGMMVWMTLVFYPLPWWPDLEGDLRI
jgi:hypothetical protein